MSARIARGRAQPIRLTIAGACGRMGQAIARCALQDEAFVLAAVLEAAGHEAVGREYAAVVGRPLANGLKIAGDPRKAAAAGDVLIDFTSPDATLEHLQVAKALGKPMVIGTTGLADAQLKTLRETASAIPIVFSPNMSLGVNVLFELATLAAQRLGVSFDAEVVEAHHRHKKDAPSGTAKRLVEALAAARRQSPKDVPVHAVRAGDIVGDHTVILAGPAERLELTHRAHSREVFAQGALKAAQFVVRQKPGLYDMSHVLKASG